MINEVIQNIKMTNDGIQLVEVFKQLFLSEESDTASDKQLAQCMGLDAKVINRLHGASDNNKYNISTGNLNKICEQIAFKLDVSLDEIKLVLLGLSFLGEREMKITQAEQPTEEQLAAGEPIAELDVTDFPEIDGSEKKYCNDLKTDFSYVLSLLGYELKDEPNVSGLCQNAIYAEIQPKGLHACFKCEYSFEEVLFFGVDERNYPDVLLCVNDRDKKKRGLIILCCENTTIWERIMRDRLFRCKQNIFVKVFGTDNKLYVKALCYKNGKKKEFENYLNIIGKDYLVFK